MADPRDCELAFSAAQDRHWIKWSRLGKTVLAWIRCATIPFSAAQDRWVSLNRATSLLGLVCISAWLFTIGLLHLTFWKGVLAIVLWPYYLGVLFQRAGALSTSRSGQYQALAICSRGVN